MKQKTGLILKYVGMFLCPVILYYLMEAFHMNAFVMTRWRAQILNAILFEFIMLFLFFVSASLRFALVAETLFAFVVGLANYYVLSFRSNPIVPWDFLSIRTAASVAGSYNYALGKQQIFTIVGFALLLLIEVLFLKLKIDRKYVLKRLLAAVGVLAVLVGFTKMLQNDTYVSKFHLYPFLFTPAYMSQADGFAVTFLMDLQYLSVDKPDGYSKEEAEEILSDSASEETVWSENRPNIIVVMDEAFSDLGVLGDFTANQDYMPFVHSLQQGAENTITGYLNVSVKGGNTANTEFEFLTGNSMAFLPAGSIPYQQYISGEIPSLVSYLAGIGYETCAMHPYNATGWNRDKVYPRIGFDTTYFLSDFSLPSYVRKYVDDESCVKKIIQTYEEKEVGQPLFLFNVTMQNHSPYDEVYFDLNQDVSVEGTESQSLSQYLSLIKLSDASLQELVSYFKEQEESTVIVFFGDHQPSDAVAEPVLELNGMTYSSLSAEEESLRYEVPYVVWANYDIEEKTGADTSANFLAAQVLDAAGVPLSDYESYLLKLSSEVPIVSAQRVVDANGNVTTAEEAGDLLATYQKLQYYRLFDAGEGEE